MKTVEFGPKNLLKSILQQIKQYTWFSYSYSATDIKRKYIIRGKVLIFWHVICPLYMVVTFRLHLLWNRE